MQGRIVEAVGGLLHTGHAEDLSRNSERASAPFPMPLRRRIGWDELPEWHIQDVAG